MVMLLCSMCVVCFAKLEQPTDDRWVIVSPRYHDIDAWFDIESIKFGTSTEIGHSGHKTAKAWIMYNLYDKERTLIVLDEFDFECGTIRKLSLTSYDSSGDCVVTDSKQEIYGSPVIPNSNGETFLKLFEEMRAMKKDAELYERFKKFMKDATIVYKEDYSEENKKQLIRQLRAEVRSLVSGNSWYGIIENAQRPCTSVSQGLFVV